MKHVLILLLNAWKGAFRECTKLASGVATEERRKKLKEGKPDEKASYRADIIQGAIMGENYGSVNIGQGDKLQKINNWNWLASEFKERKHWKSKPVVEVDTTYPR